MDKTMQFRLDEATDEALERLTDRSGLSKSAIVRLAIKKLLEEPQIFLGGDSAESERGLVPTGDSRG